MPSNLDLIHQLGEILGRPLDPLSEAQFERHHQAPYDPYGKNPDRIQRDAYCLAADGTVSGLYLDTVTSHILLDFSFYQFRHLKYLSLIRINLSSFNWISDLKELTTLDLSANNISDGSFLRELKELKTLYLNDNFVSDGSFLCELKGLTTLDLSNNSIKNAEFLRELKGLTTLKLSNNSIKNLGFLRWIRGLTTLDLSNNSINSINHGAFLQQLKGLTTLYLRDNSIRDGSFLRNLKKLTTLDLSFNNISDWSFLGELNGLTTLGIENNSIIDGTFLWNLKRLTTLDLSSNNINDWSFLSKLKRLTTLYSNSNNISDGSFLGELKGLTTLYLNFNNISDGSFLGELKGLTTLYLNSNNISDGSFLQELTGLTALDLSFNNISDGSFLQELTGLTTLYLSCSRISDGSFLRELTGLKTLDLSFNSISDGSFLCKLKGLTMLYLSGNRISNGSFLRGLKGMKTLGLSSNRISSIPRWLATSRLAIKEDKYAFNCINLYKNPITEPPIEIVRQGNQKILSFYDQITHQGLDYIYEAKMLIVGEGEAGKTTLDYKIQDPNCPLPHVDDRTRGISIKTHRFTCRNRDQVVHKNHPPQSPYVLRTRFAKAKGGSSSSPPPYQEPRTFHLNIWDFGGQEIYHATHRFFLSKRSLYVLVADNRSDNTDFNYWLNIIELFAGDSPLIIVLNEKGDIQRSLNRADLRQRYADSIKEIISVNFKTHEETDETKAQQRLKTIRALIDHIEHCAKNLPHIGDPVPARWVDVRHALETDARNHIPLEQFDDICKAQEITKPEDIDTLLGYFHDLGILLHFDTTLLRHRVILNPAWATNAVYRIFDDDTIKAKAGRFTRQDCGPIWSAPQYDRMHDVLIELMKNFRLVYEIGTTGNLVAPQLLPDSTPAYDWDATGNSHMQLRYDAFMPKGIFWQLAVTLYRYISNHSWIWRNGMVIQRGDTWAEIKEDLNLRRIALRFSGPSIAEFRAVIVDQLDSISQTYHNLAYDKMIPCQCSDCQTSSQPEFFDYAILKRRQESGKKSTIECQRSEEDVELKLLLEGFEVQKIIKTLPDKQGDETTPTPPNMPTPKPRNVSPASADSSSSILTISQMPNPMPDPKNIRIALSQALSALPPPQFEELLYVLNPPPGIISSGAQKKRASELLNWVNTSDEVKLPDLIDTLAALNISIDFNISVNQPDNASQVKDTQQPQAAQSQTTTPTNTGASSNPPSTLQTVKIFLASSSELKGDREQFEIFINRENKKYISKGIFLELVIWEDFLAAMSKTRSQDEYNKAIATCDIFVLLAYTKVGQYTEEEFLVALEAFKDSDKPLIFTYFKDASINMSSITPEIMTLLNFKQKISDMGHFYQNYADSNDLKHQFGEQMIKFLPNLTGTGG